MSTSVCERIRPKNKTCFISEMRLPIILCRRHKHHLLISLEELRVTLYQSKRHFYSQVLSKTKRLKKEQYLTMAVNSLITLPLTARRHYECETLRDYEITFFKRELPFSCTKSYAHRKWRYQKHMQIIAQYSFFFRIKKYKQIKKIIIKQTQKQTN